MFNKKTFSLLAVFLFCVITFADEIVLQNGLNDYNGCSDTHLKIVGDGHSCPFQLQNENYHTNIIIETANCPGWRGDITYTRAVYKFDLSSLSVSSDKIKNAKLSSYFLGPGMPVVEKTHLYRITKEWKADEATWLIPKAGSEMWNPGADTLEQGGAFTTDNSAETDYAEPENWEEYDIINIIKYFIDHPNENYGFILISDEEMNNTQRAYASSDFTDSISLRPKLTIETGTAVTYFPQIGLKDKINLKITNSAVSFSLPFNNSLVTISNARGQKVALFERNYGNKYEIPLAKLGAGVHFLTIKHDNKNETVKFFVIK